MEGEENQGFSQSQDDNSQGGSTGMNPAWNDLLQYVPEENYSDVQPILKNWDDNYREVQSKYKNWEPYSEAGVEPDEVEMALGLLSAVSNQPSEVRDALNQWIDQESGREGSDSNQGYDSSYYGDQGQESGSGSYDITQDPNFKRLNEGFEAMAEIMQNQRERELETQQDQELDEELNDLRQRRGDFDENYIIGQMLQGAEADEAFDTYEQFVEDVRTQARRPQSPRVLGASGAIPNQEIDPRKLDQKGTRNLVADMLKEWQQQQ